VVQNYLTGQGHVVYQQATRQMDALMGTALAGLTPADRDSLSALLAGVIDALGGRPEAAG
jgi:hypothetical protein